ncbi:DUF6875 domain-containing protein [Streptomyces sp. NPDC003042]
MKRLVTAAVRAEQWCPPRLLCEASGDAGRDDAWQVVEQWVRSYLCRPHPELGRGGAVCPFTVRAVRRRTLYGVVWPHLVDEVGDMTAIMGRYALWFDRFGEDADAERALLVAFPALPPSRHVPLIEGTQRALKTSLAWRGLMIGEFHDGPPPTPGVRNPAFRPLRSPVPLLALRRMVRPDHLFLAQAPEHRAAYQARFPHQAPTGAAGGRP